MSNAKEELLNKLQTLHKTNKFIKCAVIGHSRSYDGDNCPQSILDNAQARSYYGGMDATYSHRAILKCDWSEHDFNKFLEDLDFEYDEEYGTQHLFGVVWLNDGTWLERAEYDGSEWWSHKELPQIPKEIL